MLFSFLRSPGLWCSVALLGAATTTAPAQTATPNVSPYEHVPNTAAHVAMMPSGSSFASLTGALVTNVELRGIRVDPPVMQYLRTLVTPNEGVPLDRQRVGKSIRDLYATGRFASVEVQAEPQQKNEIRLVFIANENLFVGAVTVEGTPKRPTPSQLIDATKIELGEVYSPDKVEAGIGRMKQVMADNGYYQSQIAVKEDRNVNIQRITLNFVITAGPVARIGRINLEGDAGMSAEELMKIAKIYPGDSVSIQRITSALQRLRKRYSKQDRLESQISVTKNYRADSNDLDYTFRINRGPVIGIQVEGASVSKRKLQQTVPVFEEHAVDDDLLNEGERNLREYFQGKGFFDATVAHTRKTDAKDDRETIVYDVDRGKRHDLEAVLIDGNKYFDSPLIKERMSVQPASLLLRHGRFSQDLLARDVQNIKDLYLANGFLDVKVTADADDDYRGHAGRIAVFMHIVEGPQTVVAAVNIIGNRAIPNDTLQGLLTASPGQPYAEVNTFTDRDSVLNYYFNHGFPDATFSAKSTPLENDKTKMTVEYTIDEGPQVFVDRVLLSGLEFTKRGIATRQFAVRAGDPLSQVAMLDTQRKLYDLGVFNAVDMAVQNPEGRAHYKDVFFQFEEAKRWTFNYGFGVEIQTGTGGSASNPQGETSVSPRVIFNVTRNNVGGRAHTLTLESHVGRLEQRGLLSYDAPRFLRNEDLRLTLSTFYDNSLDVRTFTSQRLEGSIQLEQVVSRTQSHIPVTTLLYRFTYRRVRASDIVVSPDLIPLYSQPVRVGMPSLSYIRDHRDDPIDSHTGSYNTFDTGVASGVFGSEAAFGRFSGQNTTYHQFHAKRWVFARNTRLGLAAPFGDTKQLPLPERFFAGGGNSHRGFAINQAGPRDLITGQPLGGNAVFVNNLEVRTPPLILPFVADNMSLALFHDMGNVFMSTSDMVHSLVRWKQPHQELCTTATTAPQCSFDFLSHALGIGVRYKTPVGPVRLDFGYNLNPPKFPVFTTDATTKITTFAPQTLKHFNFYFSIGQTF